MKNVGDVSDPVLSSFGYHVIRLDGRHPERVKTFDEVKESLLIEERKKFIDAQREETVAAIRNDPLSKMNESAVGALVIKVDPELARKATEASQPK
jgi:peptidyl-prolyl cis-trans isomerase C